MAKYTKEEVQQLAEEKVKSIISSEIYNNASIGILNLDREITTGDYDGGNLFDEFLSMCQKKFADLEFTCYVDYNTNTLNIAWDNADYTKDKNDMKSNTALIVNNNDVKKYPEWLNDGVKIDSNIELTRIKYRFNK